MLLDKGADVNALGNQCWGTALQYASENGRYEIVKLLLANGADVNVLSNLTRNRKPFTALQLASEMGRKDIMEMLRANGAVMPDEVGSERLKEREDRGVRMEDYSGRWGLE